MTKRGIKAVENGGKRKHLWMEMELKSGYKLRKNEGKKRGEIEQKWGKKRLEIG